jgi:hypothetical protein
VQVGAMTPQVMMCWKSSSRASSNGEEIATLKDG